MTRILLKEKELIELNKKLTKEGNKHLEEIKAEREKIKTFHFNFSIDTKDTFSEQDLQEISENLLVRLNGVLFNRGYHLPSLRIINEWYKEEDHLVGYGGDPQSKKFSQEIRKSLPDSEKEVYEGSPLQLFLDDGKKEFVVPLKEIPSFKCNRHQVEKCYRCIKKQKACPRCGSSEVRVKRDYFDKKDKWFFELISAGCFIDYCPFCGVPLWHLIKD